MARMNALDFSKQFHRRLLDFKNAPSRKRRAIIITFSLAAIMIIAFQYLRSGIRSQIPLISQSPPTLLVAIMSTPWKADRRSLSERTCTEFKAQNIECVLFDAVDIRTQDHSEDNEMIRHFVEETKVLSKQYVDDYWVEARGKIGHTLTFLMMMEWLKTKTFDYVLFLEDDAVIPDIAKLSDMLMTQYLPFVHYDVDGVYKELDAIHLSRSRCDNLWFRWMAFTNPDGNRVGLWENRSGALSRFWSGKTAIIFSRKWIDRTMDHCLNRRPIDYFVDIWMSRFVVDGTIRMFTICPNMVAEAGDAVLPSVIHSSSKSLEAAKKEKSNPYIWPMVWDTILCILYTIAAMSVLVFVLLALGWCIFKFLLLEHDRSTPQFV